MGFRNCLIALYQCLILVACSIGSHVPDTAPVTPKVNVSAQRENSKDKSHYEVLGKIYETMYSSFGYVEIGVASWYGGKFHGRLTSMGELYNMYAMTAAHKSLPLPTIVKVTNLDNGRSIKLKVNDRGPFHDDRLIDLSYGAAKALGFEHQGTAPVVVEAIDEINHPELIGDIGGYSYYLQAGAFSRRQGAESQMTMVKDALPPGVQVRILISETNDGKLHKIWIGPMATVKEERHVAQRIEDLNIGMPIKIRIGNE